MPTSCALISMALLASGPVFGWPTSTPQQFVADREAPRTNLSMPARQARELAPVLTFDSNGGSWGDEAVVMPTVDEVVKEETTVWEEDLTPLAFVAKDGLLYANGAEFSIKGTNWFGSENRNAAPLGLHKHEIKWYMEFLADNNFNSLRPALVELCAFYSDDVVAQPDARPPMPHGAPDRPNPDIAG
jgi:hypothetical protein